jgi:hypothetical protein
MTQQALVKIRPSLNIKISSWLSCSPIWKAQFEDVRSNRNSNPFSGPRDHKKYITKSQTRPVGHHIRAIVAIILII